MSHQSPVTSHPSLVTREQGKAFVWIVMVLIAIGLIAWGGMWYWQQTSKAPPHIHTPGEPAHEHPGMEGTSPEQKDMEKEGDVYYCSMHPDYVSDKPGNCPICGMKLEKREKKSQIPTAAKAAAKVEGYTTIGITPEKQQLIGVRTIPAKIDLLTEVIRAAGRVAYDPELYEIEQEYFEAQKMLKRAKEGENDEQIAEAERLADGALQRLKLLGIKAASLKKRDPAEPDSVLLLPKPNRAWIYAEVFQEDLSKIRAGTKARIWQKDPSHYLVGTVVSMEPRLNPDTRTARARILVNPKGHTLPLESFVNTEMMINHGKRLVIPLEAVIETGERQVVFVDLGNGFFEPREVHVGVRGKDLVEIRKGVRAGETVVASANFLVDSESRMKAALEAFLEHKH